MKKILAFVLAVVIAAGSFSVVADAASVGAGVVSVTSGNLNVRSSPSSGGSILTVLSKGSYLTLSQKSGSWWRVEYANGKYGYCHANYINTVPATKAEVATGWGSLNVRSGAGTGYAKVESLPKGTDVMVLSTANGWSRILYHGSRTGYVSSAYLKEASLAYPTIQLNVPDFKQTDSRWSGVKIGASGKTIGQIGCATTGVAMMQSYRTGKTIYPDAMSKQLSYSSGGNLYWPTDYTVVTQSSGYLNTIYGLLRQGKPVLFGAKNSLGGQHWVVVTGYSGGSRLTAEGFVINDPGSHTRTNLQQLLNSYPNFYKFFHY